MCLRERLRKSKKAYEESETNVKALRNNNNILKQKAANLEAESLKWNKANAELRMKVLFLTQKVGKKDAL